jgi:two-component system chemotaxis response regulator CheY
MGVRVLTVDDQAVIRRILRLRFEQVGCEVEEAESALAGLKVFSRFHPDLITLDIVMPNVGGLTAMDLLEQVRKTTDETDVIVISSITSSEEQEKFRKQGAIGFISKPFDTFEGLIRKVGPLIEAIESQTVQSTLSQRLAALR